MRTIAWLIAGLVLLGLKSYLESVGDGSAAVGGLASINLPATWAMLAASTCFYRSLRSALASIIFLGSSKRSGNKQAEAKPSPVARMFAAPPAEEFDADAAFERYMDQRAADETEVLPVRSVKPPAPRPRPQAGFGRRVV